MNNTDFKNKDFYFLKGGGETGELSRIKDWSKTALGDPATWPESLCTIVSLMFDSHMAMCVAWGDDHIQIYNDAFRSIFGSNTHELGTKIQDGFAHIWNDLEPKFEIVKKGESTCYRDFCIQMNRNGLEEDCYFDLSFSPIRNCEGKVSGALLTISETTQRKKTEISLKELNTRYKSTLELAPVGILILKGSNFLIDLANESFLKLIDEKDTDLKGKALFEILPEIHIVRNQLENVLVSGIPYHGNEIPLQLNKEDKRTLYFDLLVYPHKEEDGNISGVIFTFIDVTQNVETRNKTEERKRLYESITQNTPDLVYVWDLNYQFSYANDALLNMWGRTWEDCVGREMEELGYEKWHADMHRREIDQIVATKQQIRGVVSFPHATLGTRVYDYILNPVINKNGEVEAVSGTTRDISEIKKIEEELKKSEEQFSTLANNMENLAWIADGDGAVYWYNNKWQEYTGLATKEMEGWDWQKVIHPDYIGGLTEMASNIWTNNEPFEMTFPIRRHDGEFRWFLTRGYPVTNEEGKVERWIGTNTDINIFKEAEEHFRQMAESMPQQIWTSDAQGHRNYFNQVMIDYTGLTHDELMEWGWEKIVHPEDWTYTEEKWNYSIKTGEEFKNKNRLMRHDGKYLWHLVKAVPIKDEQGKIKMWIGSKTEIQDQVELTETLGENLKESDRRIETMLQHSPDGVISIDEEGLIVGWNAESENIFGWKANEVIGKSLADHIFPENHNNLLTSGMKRFLSSGEEDVINKSIELSALNKYGVEFPIEIKISISQIKNQFIFIGFVRDITLRKETEETILNKTNQLIEAQELAHIGSWDWDVSSNKIEWSDELYRIFGLNPREFKADYESYLSYIHPEDREQVNATVQQAFADHQPYNFFHRAINAQGSVRILSSTGKVFCDDKGNVIRMSGTAQDVTDHKKYEEELKISEERFYKIFDHNPVAMSLTEIKTNKILYANKLYYDMFGYSEEEVIGHTSEELELLDPEENKRVIDVIFGFLNETRSIEEIQNLTKEESEELVINLKLDERMKDFEVLYTRKNGEKFPATISFDLIKIGPYSYTVSSYKDISERKKAEALLKSQNEKLEKMNKELESFAYVSSHDLQEPLRKIQIFTSRIIHSELQNLSESGKDMFHRMQLAAKRMQVLIQDLLAYSRTEANEVKFETTDLNDIITDIKEDLREDLIEKNATIEVSELCKVDALPFQMRQLMHNLIGNSLKFACSERAPIIKITSKIAKGSKLKHEMLDAEQEYCHITVSDNGVGFEEKFNEKIFEVFQRLHNQREYAGTGIGLAIVKKIVDNHKGIISASGKLNEGATFDIYLPMR